MRQSLEISLLRQAYREKRLTPTALVKEVLARIKEYPDPAVWISLASEEQLLSRAQQLERTGDVDNLSLYGIPFAVKDNIDALGFTTTAACPAYGYLPERDAFAVKRLVDEGAILIGKTNLDQFATGLVGTRSPYGAPRSVFNQDYISGGSSSGSAVAVAAGLVSFSLGTDTAGSGRVPAAFNNIVGVKPTKGLVSTSGVVPACRSLDCVTVFAASCAEADFVRKIMQGADPEDPYSRTMRDQSLQFETFCFGILSEKQREFYGDCEAEELYLAAIRDLEELGGVAVEIDYDPFANSAALLYSGPWVAERTAAIESFLSSNAEDVHPIVRSIVDQGKSLSAMDVFKGEYRLQALSRQCDEQWEKIDLLLLPTAPTVYKVEDIEADPILLNSRLGTYTNFVNLLDCCAVAVPAGFRPSNGLPFGVTLIAKAFNDDALAFVADRLHRRSDIPLMVGGTTYPLADGPTVSLDESGSVFLAVVGAHLSGQPLNCQLTQRGARFIATTRTAVDYQLFALNGTSPPKPGLIRKPGFSGRGMEVELWELTNEAFGSFVKEVSSPLGIGTIFLEDGQCVKGFICEPWAVADAEDITTFGGWRNYLASLS